MNEPVTVGMVLLTLVIAYAAIIVSYFYYKWKYRKKP